MTDQTLIIFFYIIYTIISIPSPARQLLYLHEHKITSFTISILRKINKQNMLNFVHDYKMTPIFLMVNKKKILTLYSGKYGTSITQLIYSILGRQVPTKVQSCNYIANYSFQCFLSHRDVRYHTLHNFTYQACAAMQDT